jgi:hypothetical protein
VGQTHVEAMQERPPPHATPQPPQLAGSLVKSTQLWPHAAYGAVQPPTHDPAWQKLVAPEQTLPQPPQFCGSLSSTRQTPSQTVLPAGQTHDPEMHAWPPPQARSQLPQWFGSVAVSTQATPQLVCPGPGQPQLPFRQLWLDAHRFPHFPQFAESVRTSVQVAPQASSPAPQVVGPSGGPSGGAPPSQFPPVQVGATWQGTPVWQRFSSVRPQPVTATAARTTTQIPSSADGLPLVMRIHSR